MRERNLLITDHYLDGSAVFWLTFELAGVQKQGEGALCTSGLRQWLDVLPHDACWDSIKTDLILLFPVPLQAFIALLDGPVFQ